jgi:prepilin-type N-terminal cleavage/methylation domain-containing protein
MEVTADWHRLPASNRETMRSSRVANHVRGIAMDSIIHIRRIGPRRGPKAFTLIELLVVVSIIALLVAILLPALGKAKSKASAVVCASRIKGLGMATATYLTEYENTFPINGLELPKDNVPTMYLTNTRFTGAAVSDSTKWRLEYGALWPIMGGTVPTVPSTALPLPQVALAKAYLCPDDTLARSNPQSSAGNQALTLRSAPGGTSLVTLGNGSPGYWSYSVNSVVNSLGRFRNYFSEQNLGLPWIDPIKTTSIANPTNFLMFIEEDQASPFNDEVFDAPALGGGDRLTNRHNNGGNLGFGDYHVEWVSEVTFDLGGGNPAGTSVPVAMQSPWTSSFFPDPSAVPTN